MWVGGGHLPIQPRHPTQVRNSVKYRQSRDTEKLKVIMWHIFDHKDTDRTLSSLRHIESFSIKYRQSLWCLEYSVTQTNAEQTAQDLLIWFSIYILIENIYTEHTQNKLRVRYGGEARFISSLQKQKFFHWAYNLQKWQDMPLYFPQLPFVIQGRISCNVACLVFPIIVFKVRYYPCWLCEV